LAPCDEGERGKGLGLEFEGEVEVLDDGVDTEWYAACVMLVSLFFLARTRREVGRWRSLTYRPENQHSARKAFCALAPPVGPYLWDNLYTPTPTVTPPLAHPFLLWIRA